MRQTFIILFLALFTFAGARNYSEEQVWADYYQVHKYESLYLMHRVGGRISIPDADYYFGSYRIEMGKRFGYLQYKLGTAFLYENPLNNISSFETRPWGGMLLAVPVRNRLTFSNYLRLENRFKMQGESFSDVGFSGRLRCRMGFNSRLSDLGDKKSIEMSFLPEFFIDLGGCNAFYYNELRMGGGLAYNHKSRWVAGLKLSGHYVQENQLDLEMNRNIVYQFSLKRNIVVKN
jgi:hypothetical protein